MELENLERQQKQQVEKMEQDHAVRRRDEAKRIRLEQERDYARFQEQLKLMKKEVRMWGAEAGRPRVLGSSQLQVMETPAPPHLNNRGNSGELVPLRRSRPGMSASLCSSCAIRAQLLHRLGSAFLCVDLAPGRPSPCGPRRLPILPA